MFSHYQANFKMAPHIQNKRQRADGWSAVHTHIHVPSVRSALSSLLLAAVVKKCIKPLLRREELELELDYDLVSQQQ